MDIKTRGYIIIWVWKILLNCYVIYLLASVGALSLGRWSRGIRPSPQSNMPIKENVWEDKLLTSQSKKKLVLTSTWDVDRRSYSSTIGMIYRRILTWVDIEDLLGALPAAAVALLLLLYKMKVTHSGPRGGFCATAQANTFHLTTGGHGRNRLRAQRGVLCDC